MNFKHNYSAFIILSILISLCSGFINYEFLSPKNIPLSYTSSNILILPSNSQESTFIFTTKGLNEWSSLKEIQSSTDKQVIENPSKADNFDIKFNPDISSFMKNYYNLFSIQSKILSQQGVKIDFNLDKLPIGVIQLGNGMILVEKSFESKDKAEIFSKIIKQEQINLIKTINSTRSSNDQYNETQANKEYITENAAVNKKSILQFFAGFIIVFSILFYIFTSIRNNQN